MKNILILADGAVAKHFVDWIGRKRVVSHRYYVTCFDTNAPERTSTRNITFVKADPTSYARIKHLMNEIDFAYAFVVMQNREDAYYALKNIRMIDTKMHVVLTDQWDDGEIGRDEVNTTVLDTNELMAAHLYDHLPDVPVVAQNVGLGKGEIMEMLIPFGSTFAFRHVGSILQRKWKIAAIYRNDKQILPTNATMIRPNDTILAVGNPLVLDSVYRTVNKRIGLFPEPFGKDLYLLLDFDCDRDDAVRYMEEALYLREHLQEKRLHVRILHVNDFSLLEKMKAYESDNVFVHICYDDNEISRLIEYDIQYFDIGSILCSHCTFGNEIVSKTLYELRKTVYLFGEIALRTIENAIVMMDETDKMESISSTAFDIAESLKLSLCLCYYDPEGDFEAKRYVIEHYEALSGIFDYPIRIEKEIANPVRKLHAMQNVLQIAPFEEDLSQHGWFRYFSTALKDFLLTIPKHPKLLVPYLFYTSSETS